MIICPHEKIGFMNIPKTGTRSVLAYFNEHFQDVQQHGHRINPPKQFLTDEYFRFATIRNPYDRIVSFYWSTMEKEYDRYGYKRISKEMNLDISLKSFLKIVERDLNGRREGKKPITQMSFFQQIDYIEGKDVHQIIHLENLDEEFNKLPFINKKVSLPQINATSIKSTKDPDYVPRPKWQEMVGMEEIKLINKICANDFEAFKEYKKLKENDEKNDLSG